MVIAIIAILAALLLPALTAAKRKAQQVYCVSNLKQLGLGLQLYVNNYDDTFPGCASATTYGFQVTDWIYWRTGASTPTLPNGTLATANKSPILRGLGGGISTNVSVFRCPADISDLDRLAYTPPYFYSYTMTSYNLANNVNLGFTSIFATSTFYPYKLSWTKNPTGKIVLGEQQSVLNGLDCSVTAANGGTVMNDGRWTPDGEVLTSRHSRQANEGFADWHVEVVPWQFGEDLTNSQPNL